MRYALSLLACLGLVMLAHVGCGGGGSGDDGAPQCSNGVDDDADGLTDYPDDPGCTSADDNEELDDQIPECSNGQDDDADGLVDYPNDPGCFSALQNDETDHCPDGADCPQCANDLDDDGNGVTDYPQDPGCEAASDNDESGADPGGCSAAYEDLPAVGSVYNTISSIEPVVQSSATCGGAGGERIYRIHPTEPVVMVATTDVPATVIDTVLYVRTDCADVATEVACNDNAGTGVGSTLTAVLDPGYYYIVVDTAAAQTYGAFQLMVTFYPGAHTVCDPTATDACPPGLVCRTLSGATEPTCEAPVCSDGVDDDSDGVADYPGDPGCASAADATEEDTCPSGADCPQCANGVDDDGDGQTDYPADSACHAASQTIEGCGTEQDPIGVVAGATSSSTTAGASADFTLTCGYDTATSPDRVYLLTLPTLVSTLQIDTDNSGFDTVIALKTPACDATDLACNDDGGTTSGASQLDLTDVAAGTYVVVVDGYSGDSGAFALNVHGTVPMSSPCSDPLFAAGALACATGSTCDGTICVPPQCSNGVDDDHDGKTDFPAEPGCTDPLDDDETDTCPGVGCPVCANGVDDDGDNATDYPADPNCVSAIDSTEACEPDTTAITASLTTGTTATATSDLALTCGSGTGTSNDRSYALHLPVAATTLHLDTEGSAFDTVLALKTPACDATDVSCNDDGGVSAGASSIDLTDVAAGDYVVVVDGYSGASGAFNLAVHGVVAAGAACTDPLFAAGVLSCPASYTCDGSVCAPPQCSNGVDDDHDGVTDFPAEPGCADALDNDEADACPGPGCPACANGADDDGDGVTDYPADINCLSASDPTEGCETDATSTVAAAYTTGTSAGATTDFTLSCGTGTNTAPDRTYALTLPALVTSLQIDTAGSAYDTVIALKTPACNATDLFCNDNDATGSGGSSRLALTNVAAGNYIVVVDGAAGASGAYALSIHGIVTPGGSCASPLFAAGVLACPAAQTCNGTVCAP